MTGFFSLRFLRKNQKLEVYFYAVPRICLELMGYWPNANGTLRGRALIHFVILTIGVLTELHAGFMYAYNSRITLALETFCPAGTSAVTLVKMFLMLRYRRDLFYVVDQQRQLLFNSSVSLAANTLTLKKSLMAARFNFWPVSAGFSTASLYNLKPLLLALFLYISERADEIAWTLPFNMTMPKILLVSPFFPVTYIFSAYTGYITVFMFGGCDAFYFQFCVNIGCLFKSLQMDISALFHSYRNFLLIQGPRAAEFEVSLVALIKRQNQIIELTHVFRKRYRFITLLHFVSASIVIAFSSFNLLTTNGSRFGTVLYICYTIAALSQLFIYCYGGTLVTESFLELATVMGSSSWHLCLPKHRRFIHLFILRSQRALTLAVPFFSPSLSTFAAILQTSGSIIALAKSFQ